MTLPYVIPPERRALPFELEHLTAQERAAICNGCGAAKSWFDVPDYVWLEDCDRHDLRYWTGGCRKARKRADQEFYRAMVARISLLPWYRRPWLRGAALRYYWGVRIGGDSHFTYGPARGWGELEDEMNLRHRGASTHARAQTKRRDPQPRRHL